MSDGAQDKEVASPAKSAAASSCPWTPIPHSAALVLAFMTLPLIFMGGLVTSTGAGMSVPDWPTSFGHNMFALPFGLWKGPVFTEHSHRLLGSNVGIWAIVALVACLVLERRRWVKGLAAGVLGLVIAQGVLGGLRVVLIEHGLAPVHGCFAQLVFAAMCAFVTVTGKGWIEAQPTSLAAARLSQLRKLAIGLVALTYLQVLLGAWFRHTAGARLEPHATVAFVMLALAIVLVRAIKRALPGRRWLQSSGKVLHALLGTQILLGLASWYATSSRGASLDVDVKLGLVSTHIVVGALVLGTTVALALKLFRDVTPAGAPKATAAPLAAGAVS